MASLHPLQYVLISYPLHPFSLKVVVANNIGGNQDDPGVGLPSLNAAVVDLHDSVVEVDHEHLDHRVDRREDVDQHYCYCFQDRAVWRF